MLTFEELYVQVVRSATDAVNGTGAALDGLGVYDPHHLECLLKPHSFAPVMAIAPCTGCSEAQKETCLQGCVFNALERDGQGDIVVSAAKCTGCGTCLDACKFQKLVERKEVFPVLDLLVPPKHEVYALTAPAAAGQFGRDATPGRLRSALKRLGFAGMIEVALFADILTLKEALEFDRNIVADDDYVLTSCCCPVWLAMIKRLFSTLAPHVPPSVSPMVGAGRAVKHLHPGCSTVFIGPCLAKKAEAREADISDAVDYVLTFHELRDILDAAGISVADCPDDERDHCSRSGRIYGRSGGVSEAVHTTLDWLRPERSIHVKSHHVSGITSCKSLLERLRQGDIPANFIEGMGCQGGCVGGPRTLVNVQDGRLELDRYGDAATAATPLENQAVRQMLDTLGFETVDSLVEEDRMFTRPLPQ
jgi:iron only hydrogenase large subunit-like protein